MSSSYNPLTDKKLKDYKGVSISQINNTLDDAQKAYFNYKAIDFDKRDNFIDAIADEIEALGDELLEIEKVQLSTMLNSGMKSSLSSKLEELGNKENLTTFTGGSEEAPTLFLVSRSDFLQSPELEDEVFGPVALIIECYNIEEMIEATMLLGGYLTGTIHTDNDPEAEILKTILEEKVGPIVYNGFPTGIEVCPSVRHGGPFPSSTYGTATSVGTAAIERFCKVVCYQDTPQEHLPEASTDRNPRAIMRLVNGEYSTRNL